MAGRRVRPHWPARRSRTRTAHRVAVGTDGHRERHRIATEEHRQAARILIDRAGGVHPDPPGGRGEQELGHPEGGIRRRTDLHLDLFVHAARGLRGRHRGGAEASGQPDLGLRRPCVPRARPGVRDAVLLAVAGRDDPHGRFLGEVLRVPLCDRRGDAMACCGDGRQHAGRPLLLPVGRREDVPS